jgi:tRNA(Ile)-lysidine synthase
MAASRHLVASDRLLSNLPTGSNYLVGVSGGRDSVALLHQLVHLGYHRLIVCHLNHGLRGRAGTGDARFVEKLASKFKLGLTVDQTDVKSLASCRKMSIEAAARLARFEFFAETAKQHQTSTLFLAHHADDLVETFLINMFRGAGSAGLAGIRELSMHRISGVELAVIRPLLGVWRSDIDRYVRQYRLAFREDASNKSLGPLRNRIRRKVIPYLEKNVGREIRQNIWRTAMIMAEEESFFDELLPETRTGALGLSVQPIRNLAVALQRRTLRKWLRASDVSDVGFDLVERVRGLLDVGNGPARTNLPRDRHVRRRAGKLILE